MCAGAVPHTTANYDGLHQAVQCSHNAYHSSGLSVLLSCMPPAHLLVFSGMRCGSLPSVSRCPRPGFRRSSPGASGQPRNSAASGASAPCCDQSLCRRNSQCLDAHVTHVIRVGGLGFGGMLLERSAAWWQQDDPVMHLPQDMGIHAKMLTWQRNPNMS